MSLTTAVALVLALVSTTLTNLAYLREHEAAAELPVLCMRRPLESARILLADRSWMLGFAMETVGFLLYAAALALASLALVQSIAAGGIGVLAYVSARLARRRLSRRELNGVVLVSVLGLAALAGVASRRKRRGRYRLDRRDPTLARRHGRRRAGAARCRPQAERRRGRVWSRRRAVLLDRRRLDEDRHPGWGPARLRPSADRRVYARDGLAPGWLPSRRCAHGRRARHPADQCPSDRRRDDRSRRAGAGGVRSVACACSPSSP
jgi:hypothetical protein